MCWVKFDSPPRGRGRLASPNANTIYLGLTPAWAGKTSGMSSCVSTSMTHPRVGGEDRIAVPELRPSVDSPPRGRGRLSASSERREAHRLTPAWAGKTSLRFCDRCLLSTHPRVGGEDPWPGNRNCGIHDSPPRGRGRQRGSCRRAERSRLTPAWAGKTCARASTSWPRTTHPRVGGEDAVGGDAVRDDDDSPPRGRGRQGQEAGRRLLRRLTPAWAGKTRTSLPAVASMMTHPRVGGEDVTRRVIRSR